MSMLARLLLVVLCLSALTLPAAAAPAASPATVYLPLAMARTPPPPPPPPDNRIAFVSGLGELSTIRADGSDLVPITHWSPYPHFFPGEPTWSPDGATFALWGGTFISYTLPLSDTGIYLMPTDGHAPPHVIHRAASGYDAAVHWSPDGQYLAFTQFMTTTLPSVVMVMRPDGGQIHRISGDLGYASRVQWSPCGDQIVFTATNKPPTDAPSPYSRPGDLYLVRPDGTHLQRLTTTGDVRDPVWSPDGSELAYEQGGRIMRFDRARQQSFVVMQGYLPAWSPDGSQLAYVHEPSVMVIHRDGTQAHPISNVDGIPVGGTGWFDALRWSPDGTHVLTLGFDRKLGHKDLLLLSVDGAPTWLIAILPSSPGAWSPRT